MLDSDDLFTDDFVLGDDDLAVLDEVERKHITTQSQNTVPQRLEGPFSSKRQRTEHGWKAAGAHRNVEELEDLPEVSVLRDGTYVFAREDSGRVSTTARDGGRSLSGKHTLQRTSSNSGSGKGVRAFMPSIQSPANQPPALTTRQTASPLSDHDSTGATSARAVGGFDPAIKDLEMLRVQLEELRKSNEKMQQELRGALDIKLSREGEVSVLRRNIDKTAQEHAAQLAKLRAAKEQAEAKQVVMQKEMKEEMERLRTQFIFKQHELETSSRRVPLSVRTPRVNKDVPATPAPIPSQMRSWNPTCPPDTGANGLVTDTPSRPPHINHLKDSPAKGKSTNALPGNDAAQRAATLPGFQNSFVASDLVDVMRKGKERAIVAPDLDPLCAASRAQRPISPGVANDAPLRSPLSSPIRRPTSGDDIAMEDHFMFERDDAQLDASDALPMDEFDEFEKPSLQDEFYQRVLTHRTSDSSQITFQMLTMVQFPPSLPLQLTSSYSSALSRILEALASIASDFTNTMQVVAGSFIEMLFALCVTRSLSCLSALLELMTFLVYSFPEFAASLLSLTFKDDINDRSWSQIIAALHNISRDHLAPKACTSDSHDVDVSLLRVTLSFMESLCWNVRDDLQERLVHIPKSKEIMQVLLHPSQPPWLLYRGCRLLMFLSTYPKLCQGLISCPNQTPEDSRTKDLGKTYIDHVCLYLVDPDRHDEHADAMRTAILTMIAMLSISHDEAPAALLQLQNLSPCLVLFLTQLTNIFWEEDELVSRPRPDAAYCVQTLNQTLSLLHHLVFHSKPPFDLQHNLQVASLHRRFNGVAHMFIVALGRLSYADAPEWIKGDARVHLEQLADMARDLLELVVEGPEGDAIWEAYQGGSDNESNGDESHLDPGHLDTHDVIDVGS